MLKHFIPLWGQQLVVAGKVLLDIRKHFIPLWGQQPAKIEIALSTLMKHFIPLWGQQHLRGRHGRHSGRNISYPYGDSNVEDAATAVIAVETFRSPMGTATGHAGPASKKRRETFHTPTGTATTRPNSWYFGQYRKHFIPLWGQQLHYDHWYIPLKLKHFIPLWGQQLVIDAIQIDVLRKHFIPLWGQQHVIRNCNAAHHRNISYPYGDSNPCLLSRTYWLMVKHFIPINHASRYACLWHKP